jgi:hypothetical protein
MAHDGAEGVGYLFVKEKGVPWQVISPLLACLYELVKVL